MSLTVSSDFYIIKKYQRYSIFKGNTMDESIIRNIEESEYAVAVISADGKVKTASGHTIRPLVNLADEYPEYFKGGSVADRVIGKGAASIIVTMGVREAYGRLMSIPGKRMLEDAGVKASWGILTENIENMRRDGLCPLETRVADIEDVEKCAASVREFSAALNI